MPGSQPLDTGTATGRLMLAVIGAVGQAEREAMLERQREGIAKASVRAAIRDVCRPFGDRLGEEQPLVLTQHRQPNRR